MKGYFLEYDDLLRELQEHIEAPKHYPGEHPLATIRDLGALPHFAQGSAIKYLVRCLRSTTGRKDLFKAIHFCLMILREMDNQS